MKPLPQVLCSPLPLAFGWTPRSSSSSDSSEHRWPLSRSERWGRQGTAFTEVVPVTSNGEAKWAWARAGRSWCHRCSRPGHPVGGEGGAGTRKHGCHRCTVRHRGHIHGAAVLPAPRVGDSCVIPPTLPSTLRPPVHPPICAFFHPLISSASFWDRRLSACQTQRGPRAVQAQRGGALRPVSAAPAAFLT